MATLKVDKIRYHSRKTSTIAGSSCIVVVSGKKGGKASVLGMARSRTTTESGVRQSTMASMLAVLRETDLRSLGMTVSKMESFEVAKMVTTSRASPDSPPAFR